MEEVTVSRLWVAGTAVISLIAFVVLGVILGGPPLGWDIHIVLASAVLAVIVATASALLWSGRKKQQETKAGYPAKDERTKLLEGRAGYYTSFVSLYFMLALLWYNFLGVDLFGLPALNASQALIASLLVNALLFAGLRWYFLRKG